MEDKKPIYTIGYGSRSLEEFLEVMEQYRTEYLIDVRSVPFSRYKPEFSKPALSNELIRRNILYVFMGNELGGRPRTQPPGVSEERPDYVEYNTVKDTSLYLSGIDRLCRAFEQQQSIVLMCSEGKPENCHRSKLIGETLSEKKVKVMHIDENSDLIPHDKVMERIPEYNRLLLFPEFEGFRSRKKYS